MLLHELWKGTTLSQVPPEEPNSKSWATAVKVVGSIVVKHHFLFLFSAVI